MISAKKEGPQKKLKGYLCGKLLSLTLVQPWAKKSERLLIREQGKMIEEIPFRDISSLTIATRGVSNLTVPVVVEQKLDGVFLGLSSYLIIEEIDPGLSGECYPGRNNEFPIINSCPICKAVTVLRKNGFYERYAFLSKRDLRIHVRRLKCSCCRKTLSILSSFLLPHYQHPVTFILECIKGYFPLGKLKSYYQKI